VKKSKSLSSTTYLITGAAGFIGSAICRRLLAEDLKCTIIGIDNYSPYYAYGIKHVRTIKLQQNNRFVFKKGSILDGNFLKNIAKPNSPVTLIHTAAEVGVREGEKRPMDFLNTNTIGTHTLLTTLSASLQRVIIFSSSSIYGSTSKPSCENTLINLQTPLSTYGVSKMAMELAVYNFYKKYSVPTTIVRPFSVYGPDGRPDMLPMRLIMSAYQHQSIPIYGYASNSRDWTYIEDVVTAILAILEKPHNFDVVNIGRGEPHAISSVLKAAKAILKTYGLSLDYTPQPQNSYESTSTWADASRLQNIYGISLSTPFEFGFTKTVEYFLSHTKLYE
jgi:UDP-glucuronate 4-epimerase